MTTHARLPILPASVRVLRPGHGANCSSIGSVVDTLFVTSLLGGAMFAAVVAALGKEPVEIVGAGASDPRPPATPAPGAPEATGTAPPDEGPPA